LTNRGLKIIIIGGVAAGMSAASRARRNNKQAEIIVFEKSGDISYAACGLPYYISDDIKTPDSLIAVTVDEFRDKRYIDVRLHHEALSFDPRKKVVQVKNLQTNRFETHTYDKLVIATGARAIVPPIPGVDLNNVISVRALQDGIRIKEIIKNPSVKNAVIIGGGYIGLEMAEALKKQGLRVTVVEMLDRVMANVNQEISAEIENELAAKNCDLIKSNGLKEILGTERVEEIQLMDGTILPADLVILAIGVKPNTEFAQSGGVQPGRTGAIEISARMQTNLKDVYAAGDCAEAKNLVTNKNDYIPLGTTANKQGRVAGDSVTGKVSKFNGIVGTAVAKVFELEIARTGITGAYAESLHIPFKSIIIDAKSRADYYPQAQSIKVKLIYKPDDGRLLGAQIVGKEGAAKRIDILATALHQKMSVRDIAQLDLSYAPPFAPVWDPVLIAANQALKTIRS